MSDRSCGTKALPAELARDLPVRVECVFKRSRIVVFPRAGAIVVGRVINIEAQGEPGIHRVGRRSVEFEIVDLNFAARIAVILGAHVKGK